jgi:hypothetical protein
MPRLPPMLKEALSRGHAVAGHDPHTSAGGARWPCLKELVRNWYENRDVKSAAGTKKPRVCGASSHSGGGIRTRDLRVMSRKHERREARYRKRLAMDSARLTG